VIGVLGEGGMGRVLVARQRSLAREVAIKLPRPDVAPAVGQALLAEARIMGHLEHPAIVPVHALGRAADGTPVIVMKRIDGLPWSALIAQPDHVAWEKLSTFSRDRRTAHVEILVAVCNAVHFAHARGVVHRDLKPENVMVGEFGEIYLTDWGIALPLDGVPAHEPESFTLVGTPAFMAPEMVAGDPRRIDARTDVYLLGAILHEILTGGPRNPGRTLQQAIASAFAPQPVAYDVGVPEELAAIANKATAARREDRYPDAKALQRDLVAYLHHRGSIALSEAATRSLASLRELLAIAPAERSAEVRASVERLATEARFGFLQALRAWPENRAALDGQRDCLIALASDRIDRGDAHGARALVEELEASPELISRLVTRLEALEEQQARSAREHRDLVERAKEMDPVVGSRERTAFLLLAVVGSVVVTAFIALRLRGGDGQLGLGRLVLIPLGFLIFAVIGYVARARILATEFNRRAWLLLCVALSLLVAHRWLGLRGGDDVVGVLRGDALLVAAVFFTAGVAQQRVLAWAGIPLVLAAVIMPRSPALAEATFGVAISIAASIATLGSVLTAKRS
jgi:serine/threonine-protein kinase